MTQLRAVDGSRARTNLIHSRSGENRKSFVCPAYIGDCRYSSRREAWWPGSPWAGGGQPLEQQRSLYGRALLTTLDAHLRGRLSARNGGHGVLSRRLGGFCSQCAAQS